MAESPIIAQLETLEKQFNKEDVDLPDETILTQLGQVIHALIEHQQDAYSLGQDWLVQLFTFHPQFTPAIPRELLWWFGGECLHFLTDDEIAEFQARTEA